MNGSLPIPRTGPGLPFGRDKNESRKFRVSFGYFNTYGSPSEFIVNTDETAVATTTTSTTTTVAPTTTSTTTTAAPTTTSTTTTAAPTVFSVTNSGTGSYVINGSNNPTLNLIRGTTYTFNINAAGHPFWIKTTQTTGQANTYATGITNNGTANGTLTFIVAGNAPSTLYYNCEYHSSMAGIINIT